MTITSRLARLHCNELLTVVREEQKNMGMLRKGFFRCMNVVEVFHEMLPEGLQRLDDKVKLYKATEPSMAPSNLKNYVHQYLEDMPVADLPTYFESDVAECYEAEEKMTRDMPIDPNAFKNMERRVRELQVPTIVVFQAMLRPAQ